MENYVDSQMHFIARENYYLLMHWASVYILLLIASSCIPTGYMYAILRTPTIAKSILSCKIIYQYPSNLNRCEIFGNKIYGQLNSCFYSFNKLFSSISLIKGQWGELGFAYFSYDILYFHSYVVSQNETSSGCNHFIIVFN